MKVVFIVNNRVILQTTVRLKMEDTDGTNTIGIRIGTMSMIHTIREIAMTATIDIMIGMIDTTDEERKEDIGTVGMKETETPTEEEIGRTIQERKGAISETGAEVLITGGQGKKGMIDTRDLLRGEEGTVKIVAMRGIETTTRADVLGHTLLRVLRIGTTVVRMVQGKGIETSIETSMTREGMKIEATEEEICMRSRGLVMREGMAIGRGQETELVMV